MFRPHFQSLHKRVTCSRWSHSTRPEPLCVANQHATCCRFSRFTIGSNADVLFFLLHVCVVMTCPMLNTRPAPSRGRPFLALARGHVMHAFHRVLGFCDWLGRQCIVLALHVMYVCVSCPTSGRHPACPVKGLAAPSTLVGWNGVPRGSSDA